MWRHAQCHDSTKHTVCVCVQLEHLIVEFRGRQDRLAEVRESYKQGGTGVNDLARELAQVRGRGGRGQGGGIPGCLCVALLWSCHLCAIPKTDMHSQNTNEC